MPSWGSFTVIRERWVSEHVVSENHLLMVDWLVYGYFLFALRHKCPSGMHIQCCRGWWEITLDYWMRGWAAIPLLSHQVSEYNCPSLFMEDWFQDLWGCQNPQVTKSLIENAVVFTDNLHLHIAYSRVCLHINVFMWIQCSFWQMANSCFAFWKFLEFPPSLSTKKNNIVHPWMVPR